MPVPVVSVGGGLGSSCLDGRMTSYAGAPPDRQLDGEGLQLLLYLLRTVFNSITTKYQQTICLSCLAQVLLAHTC